MAKKSKMAAHHPVCYYVFMKHPVYVMLTAARPEVKVVGTASNVNLMEFLA